MVVPRRYGDCGLGSGRAVIFGAALNAIEVAGLSMDAPENVVWKGAEVAQSQSRTVFGDSQPAPVDDQFFGSTFRRAHAGGIMTYRS